MVVGPEFGPLAGLCVAVVQRRRDLALRSLAALGDRLPARDHRRLPVHARLPTRPASLDDDFTSVRRTRSPSSSPTRTPSPSSSPSSPGGGRALADLGQVGGADRGADLGDDDPRRGQHRRRRRLGNWSEWRGAIAQLAVNLAAIVARRRHHPLHPAPALPAPPTPAPRRRAPAAGGLPKRRAQGRAMPARAPAARRLRRRHRPRRALGAANLGVALGVGQLCFAATVVWVLLRQARRARRAAARPAAGQRRRHLEVLGRRRVDQDPPPRRLDQHRLVGGREPGLGSRRQRLAQRLRAEHLRRLRRPRALASSVSSMSSAHLRHQRRVCLESRLA